MIVSCGAMESIDNRLSNALLLAIDLAREHILAAPQSAFLIKQGSRDALAERLSVADGCKEEPRWKAEFAGFPFFVVRNRLCSGTLLECFSV